MTQEEKQLLLKDLCARLPYGVKFQGEDSNVYTLDAANYFALQVQDIVFKPYLRPMSSMTEEEEKEFSEEMHKDFLLAKKAIIENDLKKSTSGFNKQDWLNAHHFDYRSDPLTGKTLIESGLAIEAPEGMYKTE